MEVLASKRIALITDANGMLYLFDIKEEFPLNTQIINFKKNSIIRGLAINGKSREFYVGRHIGSEIGVFGLKDSTSTVTQAVLNNS